MLYSRDHVWIDETDPDNARIGITSCFGGSSDPVPIPAPVSCTIVHFRTDLTPREINTDPEGAGYIAVVSCTDRSQLGGLMTGSEYRTFCAGIDETWNASNNPIRVPPDPYGQGDTFATIEGS